MEANEVGKKIKYFRGMRNLTQNALANRAGVSPTYVYQLERGEKSPTVEYLSHICWGLDISLSQFFADQNSEQPIVHGKTDAFGSAMADKFTRYVPDQADGVKLSKQEAEFLISLLNKYVNETFD